MPIGRAPGKEETRWTLSRWWIRSGQGAARPGPLARDGRRVEGRGSGAWAKRGRTRMVARSGGEEGDRPMDLHTYAGVVEDNYQRLADLLLSPAPDASKVQRLLALDLLPRRRSRAATPSGPRACWPRPSSAFPPRPSRPYSNGCAPRPPTRTRLVSTKPSRCGAIGSPRPWLPGWRAIRSDCKHAPSTASPSTPKGSTPCAMRKHPRSRPTCIRPITPSSCGSRATGTWGSLPRRCSLDTPATSWHTRWGRWWWQQAMRPNASPCCAVSHVQGV